MRIERLFDLLFRYISHFPSEEVLCFKTHGIWKKHGIEDLVKLIDELSIGLINSGFLPGDKIAIISSNRPEWNIIDFACQQVGVISVPVFSGFPEDDIQSILQETDVKCVFISDNQIIKKVQNASKGCLCPKQIYSFDYISGIKHWSVLRKSLEPQDMEVLEVKKSRITENDIVSIIYTSGTTGKPKGVVLTHKNIISNILALSQVVPFEPGAQTRMLSFLPLSNIFERSAIYMYLYFGCCIYYVDQVVKLQQAFHEVKPFSFTSIPSILETLYDKIMEQAHAQEGVQRSLFSWAFKLGIQYFKRADKGWWYNFQLKVAQVFVLKIFRDFFGGKLKYIISGAGTMPVKLTSIFWAADLKVLEGYGMTETSPAITFSDPEDVVIGTVGKPVEGVALKISDDGEILVKGPNVMKEYFNNPALTSEVIDKEGWFHTGDIGEIIPGGYLKIRDRKKEIFKTLEGNSIAPQQIENRFKESDLIEQILVVGENKDYASALIIPGKEAVLNLCKQHKIPFTSLEEILKHPDVKQEFYTEVKKHNASASKFEKIKNFVILPESWGINTGELTPTMKVKRHYILKKYQHQIAALYEGARNSYK